MYIKPINTQADYRKTLKEIEKLMDAKMDTPEGDRLDVLTTLVEAWEEKHCPIEAPDPISAIEFVMEQQALTRKDLEEFIGSRGRVSEILNHQRPLTLSMIRKLHSGLGIPAEILIK